MFDDVSVCVKNKCICKNGLPSSGDNCVKDGCYRCQKCVDDHYLKIGITQSLCLHCGDGYHRNERDDPFTIGLTGEDLAEKRSSDRLFTIRFCFQSVITYFSPFQYLKWSVGIYMW